MQNLGFCDYGIDYFSFSVATLCFLVDKFSSAFARWLIERSRSPQCAGLVEAAIAGW